MSGRGNRAIRILLADDHPVFLEGLCTVLSLKDPALTVVGVAHDGVEAVAKEEKHRPDVVLMDVVMPGKDGIQAAREILERRPAVKIIMLTTFDTRELVAEALRAGARGYILKDRPVDEMVDAIKAVFSGAVLMSDKAAASLSGAPAGGAPPPAPRAAGSAEGGGAEGRRGPEFSPRERAIVKLMVLGKTNKEIAAELCISEKTVRNHLSRIYDMLDLHSRTRVVLWLLKNAV